MIDRAMAMQMVKMFDTLYRLGVTDAHNAADEGLCRSVIEQTAEPGVYRLLTDDYTITPMEWQLRLQMIAGRISLRSPMFKLFGRMGNYLSNYIGCFLPLAQCFYNNGISDYLAYPHQLDLSLFNTKTRVWLTAKGLRAKSNADYQEAIQQFCFDRKRAEQAYIEGYVDKRRSRYERISEDDPKKRVRNPEHWERFVTRISVLTNLQN